MPESSESASVSVPKQPESKPPLRKGMPVVIALVVILGLIGAANLSSLLKGSKKTPPTSSMQVRPWTPDAQQVTSFEAQQQLQAERDATEKQHQLEIAAAMQQLQDAEAPPGQEAANAP